jgi:putative ABC transport system permease protein
MPQIPASIRLVSRTCRREPGFLLIGALTLALGIGATVAIFTVVNSVLLQPLSYPEPERIVTVQHTAPGMGMDRFDLSDGTYLIYRQRNRSLEDLGIYRQGSATVTGGQEPERVAITRATASLFRVLRVPPARGRALLQADEQPGAEPVVVISDALWHRRFGGGSMAIGSILPVDGLSLRVVGIMPARFQFPAADVQLWLPLTFDARSLKAGDFRFTGLARLKVGSSQEQAASDLSSLVSQVTELPNSPISRQTLTKGRFAVVVRPLRDTLVGNVARILWLLLGSCGLILLIACANVANLFMLRIEKRRQEMAVRAALGASRGALTQLFLTETIMLALLAGLLGVALAWAGVRLLVMLRPDGLPRLEEIGVNWTVLAFAALVSLLSGLLIGLFGAARSDRHDLVEVLKDGSRGGSAGPERSRTRRALVVAQIALALILLTGAGLMVKSFWLLRQVDPGFDPHGVMSGWLDLPAARYQGPDAVSRFVAQLLERIEAIPGVQSAGTTSLLPLAGRASDAAHMIEEFPLAPGALPPLLGSRWVSSGYFQALHIPVLMGRVFRQDLAHKGGEAVVSSALAERFWPGRSPLGKRLSPRLSDPPQWYTIIGVVGSTREAGVDRDPVAAAYYPLQSPPEPPGAARGPDTAVPRSFALLVRGTGDRLSLIRAVRAAVWSLDPNLPLSRVQSMESVVEGSTVRTTFTMLLMAISAAVALLLGGVGIYGVLSYTVSQRTREIGVRMALGAREQDVTRLVLGEGLTLALAGIVIGLCGADVMTGLMAALLFHVSPTDVATFGTVAVVVTGVAFAACYLPAIRAAAVQPMEAMRYE